MIFLLIIYLFLMVLTIRVLFIKLSLNLIASILIGLFWPFFIFTFATILALILLIEKEENKKENDHT